MKLDMNAPPIRIRAWGKSASFTRYDTPAERDTYPMLTVPAADGILTSVYWHPGLRYEIMAIHVLSPVQIYARHSNELKAIPGKDGTDILSNHTPRIHRVIHQPEYVIDARIVLPPEANSPEDHGKFYGILKRRLDRGQNYEQPFFGLREYVCHVEPISRFTPWDADADLGPVPLMLHEIPDPTGPLILTRHVHDFGTSTWVRHQLKGRVEAEYFEGTVRAGTLRVPPYRERAQ